MSKLPVDRVHLRHLFNVKASYNWGESEIELVFSSAKANSSDFSNLIEVIVHIKPYFISYIVLALKNAYRQMHAEMLEIEKAFVTSVDAE